MTPTDNWVSIPVPSARGILKTLKSRLRAFHTVEGDKAYLVQGWDDEC